mmetsp:Transcript_31445/g.65730  ORF Transcript_31445/g.65730 Transcript_31445/m.65730 type:complete len:201 (+) Transcript_31445:526-1128(+)
MHFSKCCVNRGTLAFLPQVGHVVWYFGSFWRGLPHISISDLPLSLLLLLVLLLFLLLCLLELPIEISTPLAFVLFSEFLEIPPISVLAAFFSSQLAFNFSNLRFLLLLPLLLSSTSTRSRDSSLFSSVFALAETSFSLALLSSSAPSRATTSATTAAVAPIPPFTLAVPNLASASSCSGSSLSSLDCRFFRTTDPAITSE